MSNSEINTFLDNSNESELKAIEKASVYPLIRYMGSKYKLLPWIYDEIKDLPFSSALDGFSGSGAVSFLLKCMNKTVYSNDFLHFSHVLTKATVENNNTTLEKNEIEALLRKNHAADNFIEETYKNVFYDSEDLRFLDNISANIKLLQNDYKKSIALSALIRSSLKKQPRGVFTISGNLDKYNDGRRDLRLSIEEHFVEQVKIYNETIFSNNKFNISFNQNIFDFDSMKYNFDLVYLDPPYVPRSDDNCYVKRYHFVEGLSKYWKNEVIDYKTKVKKIAKKYTPFSYRRTATKAFDEMFSKFSSKIIVLSYSSNGYPDLDVLVDLMKKYKNEVIVRKKKHKYHFGTHSAVKRTIVDEYLIIGI
jgi:adenine-specific DNA-methyltransferase